MSDNQHITIPKKVDTKDDLDFEFLRKEGIKHIEQLGSKLWTDYNAHDPGITMLEVLSYAITDLGMRTNLKMEDILASDDQETALHKQFIKATDILPAAPLTHLDYRKLFIDIGEEIGISRPIKNCWLVPYDETIYTDCKTGDLAYDRNKLGDKTSSFRIKGQYKLLVDIAEESLEECDHANIQSAILKRYHSNRNLCEDLVAIEEIGVQEVAICTRIEVERDVDEEKVHARVLHKIEQYFAPEVHFYALNQLLDKGYTTDQIFEGPVLDNGFIDTEELRKSQLRTEIRLSDIVREIMEIDGVKQIKEISMNHCGRTATKDPWLLCLEEGKKPILCEQSSFSYSKGTLPLNINQSKVNEYIAAIEKEEELERENAQLDKELPLPKGDYYEIDTYESILNEFPDTYGVGSYGIVSKATPEREALAKQLKGYLLFFDKILASYFTHLGKVKDILSVSGSLKQTYFTQAIKGINGFDELVGAAYVKDNDEVLTNVLFEDIDNNVQRRNEVLDHLIGRFAEKFSDYTFIMKQLYGNSVDEIVLKNKEAFLADYKEISKSRGLGYNYTRRKEDQWETDNVSGVQKRIARLLGIKDYTRRSISNSPASIYRTNPNEDTDYRWEIKDGSNVVLYSDIEYQIEHAAFMNMYTAVFNAIQIDAEEIENIFENPIENGQLLGYIQVSVSAGKYSFSIVEDLEDLNIIAKNDTSFSGVNAKINFKDYLLEVIDYLKHDFTEEGIFLVENLLLKPSSIKKEELSIGIGCMEIDDTFIVGEQPTTEDVKIDPDAFIKGCEDGCEEETLDPYSYRVSIVLPGYSYRFSDPDFRKYAEEVIRQELPAHVLAKICWVGDRRSKTEDALSNLETFESKYKTFLEKKSEGNSTGLMTSTKELVVAMNQLYNIYRPGRLLDCDAEDNGLDGKIILGQSNI